jgi:CheY-like chemotaxis protein
MGKGIQSVTIIDDDEMAHYLIGVFIKRELPKATIHSFFTAVEFLEAFAKRHFNTDRILLDINMPLMSGWELLENLKPTAFATPVHILSSSNDARDVSRSHDYSFVKGYFVKPLTVEKLKMFLS